MTMEIDMNYENDWLERLSVPHEDDDDLFDLQYDDDLDGDWWYGLHRTSGSLHPAYIDWVTSSPAVTTTTTAQGDDSQDSIYNPWTANDDHLD